MYIIHCITTTIIYIDIMYRIIMFFHVIYVVVSLKFDSYLVVVILLIYVIANQSIIYITYIHIVLNLIISPNLSLTLLPHFSRDRHHRHTHTVYVFSFK